jgi:signal transduction histidine kinase
VAERSLHERIALEGPDDEITELADTFDAMLERLDRAFDSQGRFVANASHELRTPLAINRTLIEVALEDPHASTSMRQLGATLLAVNQRHERLIDGLLTLAGSAERITDPTLVDLAEVVRHVTTESRGDAGAAGVSVRTDLAGAPVMGDPVLLERLVQNLVDNALRYNASDCGWVAVTTGAAEAAAHLSVENPGASIPAYEVPGLFEPFHRLPNTDPPSESDGLAIGRGAGLGLSIVQAVARAHGGEVHATPREEGGLIVRVRLPAARGYSAPVDSPPEQPRHGLQPG